MCYHPHEHNHQVLPDNTSFRDLFFNATTERLSAISISFDASAGAVAEKSRQAFFQCFTVFAVAAEKLAAEVTAPRSANDQEPDGVPIAVAGSAVPATDARLLTLYSNCQQVRAVILPSLCER